jgi:hypothetical protein
MKKKIAKRKSGNSHDKETDAGGLEEMQLEELSGISKNDSLEVSDTDDDEDEGVGDGTIGRTREDPLHEQD